MTEELEIDKSQVMVGWTEYAATEEYAHVLRTVPAHYRDLINGAMFHAFMYGCVAGTESQTMIRCRSGL